ncbi:hypothetical protein [Amycolatopsis sp. cmx-4-54]|uniref:hypothetical protein n=1 Tax=Amycolatopsis sp. cmx-4-54 TaxID=2790936 RepID=UPI00397A4403
MREITPFVLEAALQEAETVLEPVSRIEGELPRRFVTALLSRPVGRGGTVTAR